MIFSMFPQKLSSVVEPTIQRIRASAQNALSWLPGARPAWVVIHLSGSYPQRRPPPSFLPFPFPFSARLWRDESLEEFIDTLQSLSSASWLQGALFVLEGLNVDATTAFALRRAIRAFRLTGKKTAAYLSRLDWDSYYIASATAEVTVPESADIHLHGLGISVTFMQKALAQFGVRFQKLAIDEYKNAFDGLVQQDMSSAQREQLSALLDRLLEHFISEISQDRRLSAEQLQGAMDEGVSTARRAKELGLIDKVAYDDELIGPNHKPLSQAKRFLRAVPPSLFSRRIAIIGITGVIVPGTSKRAPVPVPVVGGSVSGAESVIKAFRAAEMDESTGAIVLYVDSGGGSAMASDLIWHEVKRIRDKKPVVAVMGSVAASGGYYVLAHANRIIAAPTTVTGSIGVLTGKLVLDQFFDKYGFHVEQIQRGRYAQLFHPAKPLDDDEQALLKKHNQEIYERFVQRVADGRKMDVSRVQELARGRVWAGSQAKELGLVDEMGDLQTGIERARELAGLPPTAPVWDVHTSEDMLLPTSQDPTTLLRWLKPFTEEHTLLLCPMTFK